MSTDIIENDSPDDKVKDETQEDIEFDANTDVCRVCRSESTPSQPLFFPCLCTGSIKYVHQDCLSEWLKYSKKEICEVCNHKYKFSLVYKPDTPARLPVSLFILGLAKNALKANAYFLHRSLVVIAWMGCGPLAACRIYDILMSRSFRELVKSSRNLLSLDNMLYDIMCGNYLVFSLVIIIVSLIWLRSQMIPHLEGVNNEILRQWLGPDVNDEPPQRPNGDGEEAGAVDNDANLAVPPHPENEEEGGVGGIINWNPDPVPDNEANPQPQDDDQFDFPDLLNNNIDNNDDDLHWQRLLGLDGSFAFLQHILGLLAIYTASIIIFALLPLRVGEYFALNIMYNGFERAVVADSNDIIATQPQTDNQTINSSFNGGEQISLTLAALNYTNDGNDTFTTSRASLLPLSRKKVSPSSDGVVHLSGYNTHQYLLNIFFILFGYVIIANTANNLLMIRKKLCPTVLETLARHICFVYLMVKVSLLMIVEIVLFPLMFGLWIDVCCLNLFQCTLATRYLQYKVAPIAFIFLHWVGGMVFVFGFISFTILLREVLRPGTLWFLRSLNDPDFNAIRETMEINIVRHFCRKFIFVLMMLSTIVLVMLWLPSKTVKYVYPNFLPLVTTFSSAHKRISYEVMYGILFIGVLPFIQDRHNNGHNEHLNNDINDNDNTKNGDSFLRSIVRLWILGVSKLLGLKSYLLGAEKTPEEASKTKENGEEIVLEQAASSEQNRQNEELHEEAALNNEDDNERQELPPPAPPLAQPEEEPEPLAPPPPVGAAVDLGEVHRALMTRHPKPPFVEYTKPSFFLLRLICLVFLAIFSLFAFALTFLMLPTCVGRIVLRFVVLPPPSSSSPAAPTNEGRVSSVEGGSFKSFMDTYICSDTSICDINTFIYGCFILTLIYALFNFLHKLIGVSSDGENESTAKFSWRLTLLKFWNSYLNFLVVIVGKAVVTLCTVSLICPMLFGTCLFHYIIVPLTLPSGQTPYFHLNAVWIYGFLFMKCIFAVMSWCLPARHPVLHAVEYIVSNFFDGKNFLPFAKSALFLTWLTLSITLPFLTLPFLVSNSFFPLLYQHIYMLTGPGGHQTLPLNFDSLGGEFSVRVAPDQFAYRTEAIEMISFPLALKLVVLILVVRDQISNLKQIYQTILNENYLVGRQLVNYTHQQQQQKE